MSTGYRGAQTSSHLVKSPPRLSSVCLHFQGKGDYQGRVLYFLPLLTLPLQLKPITQENNSVGIVISPVLSVKT